MVAPLLPTAFPNPAVRSLACRPRTSSSLTLARTTPLRSPGSTPSTWLLPPMLQPDQGRGLALLKVTVHGIPNLAVQRLQAVSLRVNGGADGAGYACGNPPCPTRFTCCYSSATELNHP